LCRLFAVVVSPAAVLPLGVPRRRAARRRRCATRRRRRIACRRSAPAVVVQSSSLLCCAVVPPVTVVELPVVLLPLQNAVCRVVPPSHAYMA